MIILNAVIGLPKVIISFFSEPWTLDSGWFFCIGGINDSWPIISQKVVGYKMPAS